MSGDEYNLGSKLISLAVERAVAVEAGKSKIKD
jgi:hypothetical protein